MSRTTFYDNTTEIARTQRQTAVVDIEGSSTQLANRQALPKLIRGMVAVGFAQASQTSTSAELASYCVAKTLWTISPPVPLSEIRDARAQGIYTLAKLGERFNTCVTPHTRNQNKSAPTSLHRTNSAKHVKTASTKLKTDLKEYFRTAKYWSLLWDESTMISMLSAPMLPAMPCLLVFGRYGLWRHHHLRKPSQGGAFKRSCVLQMDAFAKDLAKRLLESLKTRTDPYRPYFRLMELIDISSGMKWLELKELELAAMKKLGERYAFDVKGTFAQLRTLREVTYSPQELQVAKTNVLLWWKTRFDQFNDLERDASSRKPDDLEEIKERRLPLAENFARIVLSIAVSTARIEAFFSVAATNKSSTRSRTNDSTIAHRLTVKGAKKIVTDDCAPFPDEIEFDFDAPYSHKIVWDS
eukprot:m.391375 g.391375  ORF g.391375 m.391375 type:complete len:412 (+) comp16759_c6_seq8:1221-2456(+)